MSPSRSQPLPVPRSPCWCLLPPCEHSSCDGSQLSSFLKVFAGVSETHFFRLRMEGTRHLQLGLLSPRTGMLTFVGLEKPQGQVERKPKAMLGQTHCFHFYPKSEGNQGECCQPLQIAWKTLQAKSEHAHTHTHTNTCARAHMCIHTHAHTCRHAHTRLSRVCEALRSGPASDPFQFIKRVVTPTNFLVHKITRIRVSGSAWCPGAWQRGLLAAPHFSPPLSASQTVRSSEQAAVFPTDTQTPVFLVK